MAEWADIRVDRAGEVFRVDGIAIVESPAAPDYAPAAARAAAARHVPVAILAGLRNAVEADKLALRLALVSRGP